MRLADYLEAAQEKILFEAIAYARTLPALKNCTEQQLRNHLPKVLHEIAVDLRTPQTVGQSIAKSHGLAPSSAYETAAENHGLQRARGGLNIEELVAEFRALRSSVLRLWAQNTAMDEGALEDIGRFNEAIDQAVAESVRTYAAETEKWQQIFLGIVGHDLRTPLNAVTLTADLLASGKLSGEEARSVTARLTRSARRMGALLDSLLEYNRATIGGGMTIHRTAVDLKNVCADELELLRVALPMARIDFVAEGVGCSRFQRHLVKVEDETGGGSWREEGHSAASSSSRRSSWSPSVA